MRSGLLLVCILVLSSLAHAGGFGAIAYSKAADFYAVTRDQVSAKDAEEGAVTLCAKADCVSVGSAENQYIALATGPDGVVGWGHSQSLSDAVTMAYRDCKTQSIDCRVKVYASSLGDLANDQITPALQGLKQPKLAEVGGPFSKSIANFRGFKQLGDYWCWAAVTETIYYAMTGAQLDQARLARIHASSTNGITSPALLDQVKQTVDEALCGSGSHRSQRCDQPLNPAIALKAVGISLPFANYPDPLDAAGVYRMIRNSLSKNIPIGLTIRWYNGNHHAVVVYGARFSKNPKSPLGPADLRLRVYDPATDQSYQVRSGLYLPSYEDVPGILNGWMAIANFASAKAHDVSPAACQFMSPDEQAKFCAGVTLR